MWIYSQSTGTGDTSAPRKRSFSLTNQFIACPLVNALLTLCAVSVRENTPPEAPNNPAIACPR